MKNFSQKFQKIMMAAPFAEAGEWDTAKDMTPDPDISLEPTWLNKVFMAATFAESGLYDEALNFLEPRVYGNRGFNAAISKDLGLQGIRLLYGTVSI